MTVGEGADSAEIRHISFNSTLQLLERGEKTSQSHAPEQKPYNIKQDQTQTKNMNQSIPE